MRVFDADCMYIRCECQMSIKFEYQMRVSDEYQMQVFGEYQIRVSDEYSMRVQMRELDMSIRRVYQVRVSNAGIRCEYQMRECDAKQMRVFSNQDLTRI